MFPFVSVVNCPQEKMLGTIGDTLVGSGITSDESFRSQLRDAVHIDRLNVGPVQRSVSIGYSRTKATSSILFRARAYQEA